MSFMVEAWATDRTQDHETGVRSGTVTKYVKLSVVRDDEPNATEAADYKSQAQGFYRRQYQEWSMDTGYACNPIPRGATQ